MNLMCRTCMQIITKYVSIFDYHENGKILSEMLVEYATIKIQKDDGLPLYICDYCLEKLLSAWDFRLMIIASNIKLHNILNENENLVQNNLFADTSVVKEEFHVKTEVPGSLIQEHVYLSNSCRADDSLEKISANYDNHTNFITDESKQGNTYNVLVNNSANESNSDRSRHTFTCKTGTVIPDTTVKEEEEENEKTSNYAETHDQMEVACNVKQSVMPGSLNIVDYSYDEKKLTDRNSSQDCVSAEDVNNIKKNKKTEIKKQAVIQDTYDTPIEQEDENEIMSQENTENHSDGFNKKTKNNMEIELDTEKVNKRLTKKEKKSVFCETCNRSFGYRYYFEVHIKLHNGDKNYKCVICGKSFVRKFQLRLHMTVHSDERPFACEICGKTFKTSSAINSHKSIHSDGYTCSICQKSFKRQSLLKIHFERHTSEKKYTCEVCGKSFVDSGVFSKHKLIHLEDTVHICSICQKSFKNKSYLKTHIEKHKNGRKHTCDVCGKSYTNLSTLNKHKQTHVNMKRFTCLSCGISCLSHLRMLRHWKLHSEARPHSCSYCSKSFKTKDVLHKHILIHTGQRPYSCKICDASFRQSGGLYTHMRIHMRSHTIETPYACEFCPSQFKYPYYLQNHMKVHK